MTNPFKYGQIVAGDDFCPRPELEKQLRGHFRSGQNVVISGERRVGKSSLIHWAAAKTRGKRLLYVDLWGIKTEEDFLKRAIYGLATLEETEPLSRRLLKAFSGLRLSIGMSSATGSPTLTPTFEPGSVSAENLNHLMDLLASLHRKRGLIVVFDEFQDILALPNAEASLAVLRARIQKLGDIPFCFAGSVRNEMWQIFSSPDSPFYKSAVNVEVTSEDFEGWSEFLIARFKKGRRKTSADGIDRIIAISGGNPGDVQQLCAAVWDATESGQTIDESAVRRGLALIFRNEHKGYEQVVAASSAQQLAVLRALARLGGKSVQSKEFLRESGIVHASSVKAAVTRLVARRVVFHDGAAYDFCNPFFGLWLAESGI